MGASSTLSTTVISYAADPGFLVPLLRLTAAVVAGGLIGLERESHGRPAGMRTHILVCVGCCIVMIVSNQFAVLYGHAGEDSAIRVDPARLAYGVVAGIGFLGAGVIMRHRASVHGLTTAASLWCAAALGLALGMGMYTLAATGTGIILLTLLLGRSWLNGLKAHTYATVRVTRTGRVAVAELEDALRSAGGTVLDHAIDDRLDEGTMAVTLHLRFFGEPDRVALLEAIHNSGDYARVQIK